MRIQPPHITRTRPQTKVPVRFSRNGCGLQFQLLFSLLAYWKKVSIRKELTSHWSGGLLPFAPSGLKRPTSAKSRQMWGTQPFFPGRGTNQDPSAFAARLKPCPDEK